MKRITAMILAVLMCFSLAGCDSGQIEKTDTMHKTISILQNNNHNRITAEDENYIYFCDVNKVMKMSKADDTVETIYTFDGENLMSFFSIEYFDGRLFMISADMEIRLVSVKTDGTDMKKVTLKDNNQIPGFYTYDGNLYLDYFLMGNDRSYIITPETLELEQTDREPQYQTITADGSVFVKKIENNAGKLYKTDADGNTALFLHRDKSVFAHHITDYYVFYILIDPVIPDKWEVYRCDLDGNNNVMIKEIPLENMQNMSYDNEYLYIGEYKGPVWKINKETLETTDISGIEGIDYGLQEVNNEKFFFSHIDTYYIDTVTGEKVEF